MIEYPHRDLEVFGSNPTGGQVTTKTLKMVLTASLCDAPFTRYSIKVQHLAQHFKNNDAGLLSPPPFQCSQIITPISQLMLSANQERGL